jgi:hypothetical protein
MLLPAAAMAQFHQGDWELTLGGSGANSQDFDGATASAQGSLGYFLSDPWELGVRQSLGYSDIGAVDGSSWAGSTRVFTDWHFDLDRFQPFIGANLGYVYGDNVNDTWEAAPEAGLKMFVGPDAFVFGMVEYQFFVRNGGGVSAGFNNGQFVYSLGIGFRF